MNESLLYLGMLIIFCFTSCEVEKDFDLPNQNKLVVLSNFSPGNSFELQLSTSKSLTDSVERTFLYPENAVIKLFENGSYLADFKLSESPANFNPKYITDHTPKANMNYTIQAKVDNYTSIEAQNTVPADITKEVYKSHTTHSERDDFMEESNVNVTIHLQLASNTTHYFQLRCWKTSRDSGFPADIEQNLLFEIAENINQIPLLHKEATLINMTPSANQSDSLTFSLFINEQEIPDNKFFFELSLLSSDYYFFHKSLKEQNPFSNNRNQLLSSQPHLIHNNIEGGLGNFSGFTSVVEEIIF